MTDTLSSSHRVQIVKEGKKRKLVINGVKLEDAGNITAKTNADEASAPLGVKCKYPKSFEEKAHIVKYRPQCPLVEAVK